jgi:spoIIIJ-associated protein
MREQKMEGKDRDLEKEEGREDEFHGEGESEGPLNDSEKPFRFEEEGYWEEGMPEQEEEEIEERVAWLRTTLSEIIELMGIKAHVEAQKREGKVFLEIKGDGGGLIIGKHGQTLDALQYIINKIAANRYKELKEKAILDTENYRGRRVEALKNMTLRMREKVKRLKKAVTIGPLNPQDRRVIHITLSGDEDVRTESKGEGFYKKLVIAPKSRGGRD